MPLLRAAAPLRTAVPFRRAVLTAGAATALAALLLGGSATYASWSDSADSGTTTTITAGQLTAEITQTGPTTWASDPPNGVFPAPGDGIVPGHTVDWTYRLTNTSASSVVADPTLRLRGTPVDTIAYEAVRPYLRGTVRVISPASASWSIPSSTFTAAGLDFDVYLSRWNLPPLNPGQSMTVYFELRMDPFVNTPQGGVHVAVEVQSQRSTSTAAQPILAMTNQVFLEQASMR